MILAAGTAHAAIATIGAGLIALPLALLAWKARPSTRRSVTASQFLWLVCAALIIFAIETATLFAIERKPIQLIMSVVTLVTTVSIWWSILRVRSRQ
jgi:hypothetical protein